MKSLFPEKYHFYIYIFALIVLVIGLPFSKFLMSVSQLILVANWLLEGNLKNKFSSFFKNKPALVLCSLLLLHFVGLVYTSDFDYAFKDIRIKAPLLVLPLIISTSKPLSKKLFNIILQLFIATVIAASIFSTFILVGLIHRQVVDIRDISIFISHIRFSLLICIAIFASIYFMSNSIKIANKISWSIIIIWLATFLIILESLTGLAILCFVTLMLLLYFTVKSKNWIKKFSGLTALVVSVISSVYYVNGIANEFKKKEIIDLSKLETHTSHGHLYQHDVNIELTENGNLIWIYFCNEELETAWNQRSAINYNERDLKGNELRYTLMRFLTSKGLRKDADAVMALSNVEIKAIERGVANVNYQDVSSLRGRIHETLWELDVYKTTHDPNGHSLTARFEYWKAAVGIIKENILFGVGTGDVPKAFEGQYVKMNSLLLKESRLRSHNQYLSITVAFGMIGLLWFLFTLFYPMIKQKMVFDFLYITFFIVAIVSFLNEDTLETQAGVTFYAFFNSFFLFAGNNQRESQIS